MKWTKSGSFDKLFVVGSSFYTAGLYEGMDDVGGDEYYILTKMDFSGNVLFSESFKTDNYKRVTGLTQFTDGYIAFTDHESYNINESLYITDSVGNLINKIELGFDENISQIVALGDTNLLIATDNHLYRADKKGEPKDTLEIKNIQSFKVESEDQVYVISSSQFLTTDVLFSKKKLITESDVMSFVKSKNEVSIH